MASFGYWLYNNYGDCLGELTVDEFADAYNEFYEINGDPGLPAGAN